MLFCDLLSEHKVHAHVLSLAHSEHAHVGYTALVDVDSLVEGLAVVSSRMTHRPFSALSGFY